LVAVFFVNIKEIVWYFAGLIKNPKPSTAARLYVQAAGQQQKFVQAAASATRIHVAIAAVPGVSLRVAWLPAQCAGW
jgi:hypothetical protein